MASGLTTGLLSTDPLSGKYTFRNAIQTQTQNNIFTTSEKYDAKVGPTRENLANKQHQEDISKLASEIAAAETPAAKAARNDKNYFAKSAEEKKIQEKKDALQKKVDDNILEQCVKADPYYLIARDWDRKVIMAANGETVTVEVEDKTAPVGTDGNYPTKTIEIVKSPKLKKVSFSATPKKTTKTPASIRNEYEVKKQAVIDKYYLDDSKGISISAYPDYNKDYVDAKTKTINAKKPEGRKLLAQLEADCERDIATLANEEATTPPLQGKNVEPHTIAIFAPGYCMNEDCCLEHAYYILRACCKTIEDDAEAEAKKDLKDMYETRKQLVDELADLEKTLNDLEQQALEQAQQEAMNAYLYAVNQMNIKPNPKDYTAEKWIDRNPSIRENLGIGEVELDIDNKSMEIEDYDKEIEEKLKVTMDALKVDAKNYRILLEHCSFQPACPEWLEALGAATMRGLKATGEAISDGFSWTVDKVSAGTKWLGEKANSSLAFLGDLQDKLNAYVGFEGLCSLNPFGGTLGCANCPMGAQCKNDKEGLLGKIKAATAESEFLKNLNRALGLGQGQLLGNLLRCAAALAGNLTSAISVVGSISIASGMPSVLGPVSNVLGTSSLPNFNTSVADCIGNISQVSEAKSAISLLQSTSGSPLSVLQSNTPGFDTKIMDLSKIDRANTTSNYFTNSVLGNKSSMLAMAKNQVNYQPPLGSTKYYDGRNVDIDSVSKQTAALKASGLYDKVDVKKEQQKLKSRMSGVDDTALTLLA